MKKIAVGETLPIVITQVTEIEDKGKFKIAFHDDEGYEGFIYLDVELPLGSAELKIVHMDM
jgi:hypothetical protein